MGVVATDLWLLAHYEEPEEICKKLKEYIPLPPRYIYRYLVSRGMYRPVRGGKEDVEKLQQQNVWGEIEKELEQLRHWLGGPDIPIFIFPSDVYNRRVQREYDGKSGLALRKCLFLFVSPHNAIEELKAVLTHEYHHICRLFTVQKKEEAYTLLDTMVLEGLAEAAVAERYSESYHAPWTRYYTKQEAVQFWHKYIKDKMDIDRGTAKHEELLNGLWLYPDMLGYVVGFYLVQDCIAHKKLTTKQLLTMDAKEILQAARSFSI